MALWRSWLARRPVTAEVAGSSPVRVAILQAGSRIGAGFCHVQVPFRWRNCVLGHALFA